MRTRVFWEYINPYISYFIQNTLQNISFNKLILSTRKSEAAGYIKSEEFKLHDRMIILLYYNLDKKVSVSK